MLQAEGGVWPAPHSWHPHPSVQFKDRSRDAALSSHSCSRGTVEPLALPGKLVPGAFQSHGDFPTSCGPQAAAGSGLRVQIGALVGSSRPCVCTGSPLFTCTPLSSSSWTP